MKGPKVVGGFAMSPSVPLYGIVLIDAFITTMTVTMVVLWQRCVCKDRPIAVWEQVLVTFTACAIISYLVLIIMKKVFQ